MSTVSLSVRAPAGRLAALVGRVADEGLLVGVVVLFAAFVAVSAAPYMLWGDSWLTFLGGREIAAHGLPSADTLTVLGRGRPWVDQQWLAQLSTYELESRLGLPATLAVFGALVVVPFALACRLARSRGGSPRSVVVFAVLAAPAALCAVRAQAFSYFLFVPFFALLSAQARRRSQLVWLAFPLLVLWANLHGAVIVAAALTSLLGATELAGRAPRVRAVGLLVLPWACVFASPYGLSLATYYRSTAANPLFPKFIEEWAPPTFPTAIGIPFFLGAAAALVLAARGPRLLLPFEHAALAFTLLGGLTAERSIAWFSYASLLVLPPVLERSWPSRAHPPWLRPTLGIFAAACVAIAVVTSVAAAGHASERIRNVYPPAAVAAVERVVASDPRARVLAAEGSADWLLYELPRLRGRVAFDGRFEILSLSRFRAVRDYLKQSGAGWDRLARGYRILVVDPHGNDGLYRTYEERGLHVLFRNARVAVFDTRRRAPHTGGALRR